MLVTYSLSSFEATEMTGIRTLLHLNRHGDGFHFPISVSKTFTIDAITGQLELSSPSLNYERKPLYKYTIRVTDKVWLTNV